MTNLLHAHYQWRNRPAEERFQSVFNLHDAVTGFHRTAIEREIPWSALTIGSEVQDGKDFLTLKSTYLQEDLPLSNYAVGQIAARVGAPMDYLSKLPASIVANNLRYGIQQRARDIASGESKNNTIANVLAGSDSENSRRAARAVLTGVYERLWNKDVTQFLVNLVSDHPNWRNPDGYENGQFGGKMVPSGLYASDRDMFAFLIDEHNPIQDPRTKRKLSRGFFVANSEVGDRGFSLFMFLYEFVCGNNIVWGATKIAEISIRHVGSSQKIYAEFGSHLKDYVASRASDSEDRIRQAQQLSLGTKRDDILSELGRLIAKASAKSVLTHKTLAAGFDLAQKREAMYGPPNTLWANVNAWTELSQQNDYTSDRMTIDVAAGRVLQAAIPA